MLSRVTAKNVGDVFLRHTVLSEITIFASNQILHFAFCSRFSSRKSATKFLCVKTVSDKVVSHSLA